MQPLPAAAVGGERTWALGEAGRQYFVYTARGGDVALDLGRESGRFTVRRVDPKTGTVAGSTESVPAGSRVTLAAPPGTPAIFWLTR
jgi:hypothetical protein